MNTGKITLKKILGSFETVNFSQVETMISDQLAKIQQS